MKRLLALVICLLLTITSLPVTQLVFADDIVALQLNNFTSTSDMPWTFPSSSADFWKTSVDNGGYKVEQIKSDVVNASYPGGNSVLGNFVVESNADNRTETVATGIEGKMRIDLDFEALVLKNPESTNNTSYMNLTLTSPGGKTIIYVRVSNTGLTIADNASVNSATYKRTTTNANGWNCAENPDSVVLSIEYDSTTGDIATYFDGELMTKNAGVESDVHKVAEDVRGYPIGKVSVSTLSRINVGSYIKFNDIKFTQHENSSTTLAALPEKLVENVNSATETSVTLPAVSGVTWASADETAATVSGNTLTFIPSTEGTKEAEITATFAHNGANYVKTYKMTLAQGEAVLPENPEGPGNPEEPEEPEAPGTLVDSHSFEDSDVPGRKVYHAYTDATNFSGTYTTDGFVVSRASEFASGTGGKLSGELMRINLTRKVGDEYRYGLKGKYAIDLTVNGKFKSAMNLSDVYLDGYMVSSGNPDSLTTSNDTNVKTQFIAEMGKTGNTFFQVSSASDSSLATERAPIPADTDTVIRLIVDSVTGDVELYSSVDNKQTFTSYGKIEGVYKGDSIQGFIFNPGLGLRDYSNMAFKNIDIYEISAVKNTFAVTYYVDGGVYKTVNVVEGETTSDISAPSKAGYVFDGWYLDGADTAFDFETAIITNTNLYAKYSVDTDYNPATDGVVAFDNTFNYASADDAAADGWGISSTGLVELKVVNGVPVFEQVGQKILTSSGGLNSDQSAGNTYIFPAGPVSADITNRTQIINEDGKYQGEVKVDFTADIDLLEADKYTHTSGVVVYQSYADIYPGNTDGDRGILWRVRNNSYSMQNASTTDDSKNPTNTVTPEKGWGGSVIGTPVTVSTTINTATQNVVGKIEGFDDILEGPTYSKNNSSKNVDYVNSIDFRMMQRLGIGSKITVSNVKVTVKNPYFGTNATEKLAELPATLNVRDINNVTERTITLPEIDGVVWSTTSENVTIEDGVASLKREKDKTVDFAIKGTFTADGIKYSKEYSMTLAEDAYTVTYYDIDGEFYQTAEVKEGGKATSISAPAEDNYSFIGWFEEGATTAFDFDKVITSDVNLYAKYDGVASSVVFMADGNTIATLSGKFGGTVEGRIPEIPAKTGFTAVGWCVGDTDEPFTLETPINSTNMIVKAKYVQGTLNTYTVTFKVDGEVYETVTAVEGYAILSVPENPAKDNYTFEGWTLNGDLFDMNTPISSSITLNAKFEANAMNVKFYMDEQLSEIYKTEVVKYGSSYGTLPVPSKSTYMFLGWKNVDGTDFTADQIVTKDISVYATWESMIKVIFEEDVTGYTSLTGNSVEFSHSGAATALSLDNGGKMTWVKEMPTSRTFDNNLIVKFKIPQGAEDTVNRTQVYNNKLVGDHEVEVTMDVKLADVSWNSSVTANPYGYYSTGFMSGSSFNNILVNRIGSGSIQTFNNNASASSNFNATNTNGKPTSYSHSKTSKGKLADGGFESVINRLRYDTTKNYAEMTAPGYTEKAYGSGMAPVAGINAVRFNMMACFAPGDYIRVKNVKVTQYNFDYSNKDYQTALATIDKLPETIVADGDSPYSVTKKLNIPAVRGVTWSSSDKGIADATTGEITRWYDPQEVVITALVNIGDYSYSKEYKLTIEGDSSIVKETVLDETFTSEADMENWTFASLSDGLIADYSVDANGVKVSKVTAPETPDYQYETKRYFAYYDLYTEAVSDTYTSTSTKDVKGVYDVSLKLGDYVATSKVPMNIGIGYRKGTTFYPYGSIVYDVGGARFTYNYDTETVKEVDLGILDANSVVTLRVDNILGEVALIADGKTVMRDIFSPEMGADAMLNTVRVALDVNNEIGDYVSLKGVKVEKVVKNNIPALSNVISAADSLTISTVTSNPDAVSSINTLPTTVGGYKVDWKSSSSQIDVETKEVFFASTAKPVTITAEIYDANATYPVVVRKNFNLTVRAAASSDELGQFEISKLGRITNQGYSDIRYDLKLPEADNVTWTSSRTDIIGNDGKISDTVVLTEATPVTITATSNGVTKDYKLTVAPRTAQVKLTDGNLPLNIKLGNVENGKISSDITAKFTYTHSSANTGKVNIVSDNGDVLASMVATANGIYFDYKNSDYKEITLADGQTANIEILVMPDVDKVAVFVNDEVAVDYATLKTNADYVAAVESTNVAINTGKVAFTVNKYGMLTANTDNFDYFTDVKFGYASTAGINMPTDIITGGTVTWTSSNPAVLGNDGKVAEVAKLTKVNVKFTITDNTDSRIFISRDFEIVVDCNNDDNIVSGIVPTLSNLKDHSYPERNATDNDIKTAMKLKNANKADSEVVFNLGAEKSFNSMYISNVEGGIEDFVIYTSNDGSDWDEVYSGNFGDAKATFVTFDATSGSYIKLLVKQCDTKDIMVDEIKVFLSATKDELAVMDLESLIIPAIAEGSKINLPATGINGTQITWTSSDDDIIDTDGNITRPQNATTVKLTATVIANGEPVSREFDVYVDTKSTSGPSQVGGGSGGGGGGAGGGMASGGATTAPVIGGTEEDTIYSEDIKPSESTTSVYNDVKETDWYFDAVKTLTSKGIVSGDGTGYFYPTNNVTREQFVKMILEAIEVEVKAGTHSFGDVEGGAWYENYIATAVSNGIVNGVGGGNFGVGTNITRQDMAVLIERVLAYKNIEVAKEEAEPFADEAEVADYAKEAVANMKAIGLIQGYNNNYNPKDNLTRAEAATVIASLLELLAK